MISPKPHLAVVWVLVILSIGLAPFGASASDQKNADIFAVASDAIDSGEFDFALETLEAVEKDTVSDGDSGLLNFLQGKAKYLKTVKAIRICREEGTQALDELQENQAGSLREALEHFISAFEKDPDSVWAPEALYAAALVQDYGCLQRFEKAAETYKRVFEKYPDTNLGFRAKERYNILKANLDGKGHTTFH